MNAGPGFSLFRKTRGGALLLTLWCVAVLSLTIVLIAQIVSSDVDTESLRSRRFAARELALTGVAYGINPDTHRDSELLHQRYPNGDTLDVLISSEAARLNINFLLRERDRHTLKSLFALWKIPTMQAEIAVDSLIDWTDSDSLRQLNGAERDDLADQTVYSPPKNRDFRSVDEMERVRGMDSVAEAVPDWRDYFSVYSGGKIAIQDAAPVVLQAAAGLTGSQAELLEKWRNGPDGQPGTGDDHVILSLDEVGDKLGLSDIQKAALQAAFQVGGEPSRIVSTARVAGTQYRIVVVLDRRKAAPRQEYLLWEEG